jgi:HSP20 family protein
MSLIKFNNRNRLFPWNDENLNSFFSSDDFFNNDFFEENGLLPAMNIKEHKEDFEIELAAPGFAKKDFEVTIDEDILNVCANKTHEEEEKDENFMRKEFSYNTFKRSLKLPKSVNIKKDIKATYKNGILRLNLIKKDEVKETPKKLIEVM